MLKKDPTLSSLKILRARMRQMVATELLRVLMTICRWKVAEELRPRLASELLAVTVNNSPLKIRPLAHLRVRSHSITLRDSFKMLTETWRSCET
jgi:hypothetical protein